jgi:hypothetical protein
MLIAIEGLGQGESAPMSVIIHTISYKSAKPPKKVSKDGSKHHPPCKKSGFS